MENIYKSGDKTSVEYSARRDAISRAWKSQVDIRHVTHAVEKKKIVHDEEKKCEYSRKCTWTPDVWKSIYVYIHTLCTYIFI